jgi:hypothetical protein
MHPNKSKSATDHNPSAADTGSAQHPAAPSSASTPTAATPPAAKFVGTLLGALQCRNGARRFAAVGEGVESSVNSEVPGHAADASASSLPSVL